MPAGCLWTLVLCLAGEGLTLCSVRPIQTPELSKVSCPTVKAQTEEFSFLLLLNDSYMSKIHLRKQQHSAGNLLSAHFEVSSSGEYVCRSENIYPPPFTEDCRSTGVTVSQQAVSGTAASARLGCPDGPPFVPQEVMWAACALLLLYSLSVSCVATVLWRRRREEDCAVYMNTRRTDPKKQAKP